MRDRRVLALVALGVAPLLLFGLPAFANTVDAVRDPCATWGTSWDGYQEGGGTSAYTADREPADPACPEGRTWTTEAPGRALLRSGALVAAGVVALAAGLVAWASGRAWPLVAAAPLLLVVAVPLSLGATAVVAGLPAVAFVGAARVAGPVGRERRALQAFGVVVATLFVAFVFQVLRAPGQVLAAALVGVLVLGLQYVALAALALWPIKAPLPQAAVA